MLSFIIENYISQKAGIDLKPVFDQYLRDIRIPILSYNLMDGKLFYRWENVIDGFDMPVKIYVDGKEMNLTPTQRWQTVDLSQKNAKVIVDKDYYVGTMNISGS